MTLDGKLPQSIGVSGTYDTDSFQASLSEPYPSIRLDLKEVEGAAIILSSIPKTRADEQNRSAPLNSSIENTMLQPSIHPDMLIPHRLASLSKWVLKCVPDAVQSAEGPPAAGDRELTYVLYREGGKRFLASDFLYDFPASTGIIHIEYPDENAEDVREQLLNALATLTFTEGDRPALAFAAYDLAREDARSADQLLAILTHAESLLNQELPDLRLNAELLELLEVSVLMDARSDTFDTGAAGETAGEGQGTTTDPAAAFAPLAPYGIYLEQNDSGQPEVTFKKAEFLAHFQPFLPPNYAILTGMVGTQNLEEDMDRLKGDVLADTWLRLLKASTNYALIADDLGESSGGIGEGGLSWRDPIMRTYHRAAVLPFYACITQHANEDGTLNSAVYDAITNYLVWIAEIEQGLPEGLLKARLGLYPTILQTLKNRIDEKGGSPLSAEETESFLKENDPLNNIIPSTEP